MTKRDPMSQMNFDDIRAAFVPYVTCSDDHASRTYDIFSRLLRDRGIILSGEINDRLADLIIAQILHLAAESSTLPINMYINSPGGSVTSGLAIYDAMRYVECPIHTIVIGQACSAATLISVSGDWRAKTQYARMMLHQASGGMSGQAADMRRAMEEMNEISRIIEEIYLRHTKIPADKLQEILDRDTFIRGELALKWHLIDKIVEARKDEHTKEEGNV